MGKNYNSSRLVNGLSVDASGNVGLGTASPSVKLDVNGGIRLADAYELQFGGTTASIYGSSSSNQIRLYTNNAERLRAESSGNIQITTNNVALTQKNAAGTGTVGLLRVTSANTLQIGDGGTANPTYVTIPNGNVGIGTNTPSSTLDVTGTGNFTGNLIANGVTIGASDIRSSSNVLTLGGTSEIVRIVGSTGRVGIGTTTPARKLDVFSDGAQFGDGGSFNFYMNIGSGAATGLTWTMNGTDRLRITAGGILYAINSGVDATYQPMIGGMYNANNNETNLISTAVSSAASQSGFRFDVSNGAGSTGRTTSMYINRTSVTIVGSLSKGSGSFKIDHPLESKKDTHHLVHSFVESPQANNIYRGKIQLVNGMAQVNLDEVSTMTEGTFVLLNREIHTYTSNETDWDAVRGKVEGNILTIECQNTESNAMVSWLVIGERQDKHMMDTEWTDENGKVIVEPSKTVIETID